MFLFGVDPEMAAQHLRGLADDLDAIAAGKAPTAANLAGAPLITGWRPELTDRRDAAVSGTVSGDPVHPDGERIQVEIVAADPDLGWVRGLLSWYRLGPSASELGPCGHA